MTATQPRVPGRLVTLNPFELGASSRASETASPPDLGCVDWYLYPVNGKAPPAPRSAPRGTAAVPSREHHSPHHPR